MKRALIHTALFGGAFLLLVVGVLAVSNFVGFLTDQEFIDNTIKVTVGVGLLTVGSLGIVFLSHLPYLEFRDVWSETGRSRRS